MNLVDFQLRPLIDEEVAWRSVIYAPMPAPDIPVQLRYVKRALNVSAEALFVGLFGASRTAVWLDSSRVMSGLSRFSYMGDAGDADVIRYSESIVMSEREGEVTQTRAEQGFFRYLRERLRRYQVAGDPLPFDFAGGFIGYFGYELKTECGGRAVHRSGQPDAAGLWVRRFLAVDHASQEVYAVAVCGNETEEAAARAWLADIEQRLDRIVERPAPSRGADRSTLMFALESDAPTYAGAIDAALEYINAGDTYEVCLTNRIRGRLDVDPLALYRILRKVNPAPFAAYLRLDDLAVLCSSPERFLRIDRERNVEAKPIKGTAPRSKDEAEDRRIAAALAASEKDRSENLMIVDLLRNDLGRVCEIGSISVPVLMGIESYATVHQMVSTITGRLRADVHAMDCIRAAFPGGSMTGAPKIHTMEILDELEGSARGVYSGALGYVSLNGCADLNIVIRTIVLQGEELTIGVGGAIVAASQPQAEFDETLLKAKALLDAVALSRRGDLEGTPYVIDGASRDVKRET
jgi:para-aminobenzoate synthetase